jgi:cysteine desulfurase / selenocysteine lyase
MPSLAPSSDFPGLQGLTYLNSASVSVTPLPVMEEVLAFERQVASQGTLSFGDEEESRVYDGVRTSVARMLNAQPADIAVMSSATECIGQIAWWLRPGKGKNVVSMDVDFPSVTYPWLSVSKATGCEVRLAKFQEDPASVSFEAVAKLVDKNTAAISISHVQYATGHRLDPVRLADLAHSHGALLVLDVTQSAGVVPLDVRAAKFDVVLSSDYKWLCGPFCAAFCYLHPDIWRDFQPPFAGWHSTKDTLAFDATRIDHADGARRMEYSTVAYGAGLGMASSVEYLSKVGIDRIFAHNSRLATMLMDGLERLGGKLITPRDEAQRAAIVAVTFPNRTSKELAAGLYERKIICASRLGILRISPHLFNSEEHVERCLSELKRLV